MTLQTAAGFLLTAAMIYAVSLLDPGNAGGWRLAFALLALGPVVGSHDAPGRPAGGAPDGKRHR
jgi:hypothetical protein